jgi:RNA polymerase sigma factor (TIGR02999 family)
LCFVLTERSGKILNSDFLKSNNKQKLGFELRINVRETELDSRFLVYGVIFEALFNSPYNTVNQLRKTDHRTIMTDVTRILNAIEQGDGYAVDELLPLVYDELRRLADRKLSQEQPGRTLQATALVHEAYIRLVEAESQNWDNRRHFFAAAAEAMRRILIENARNKKSLKRGGNKQRVTLDESIAVTPEDIAPEDLLAFNDALERLAQKDRTKANLIKLRVFAGLTGKQAAQILGISPSKACEDLAYARAWLCLELNKGDRNSHG